MPQEVKMFSADLKQKCRRPQKIHYSEVPSPGKPEKRRVRVTIQSRVVRNKFCWGLGVRAVRAGSIGRDDPRLEENTASPKWGREALAPALSTKIPAPYDSKRTVRAPRPGHLLAFAPVLHS